MLRDLRGDGAPGGGERQARSGGSDQAGPDHRALGRSDRPGPVLAGRQRNPACHPPAVEAPSKRKSSRPARSSRSQKTAEELLPWVAGGVGRMPRPAAERGVDSAAPSPAPRPWRYPRTGWITPPRACHELFGISIAEIERGVRFRAERLIRAYAAMETTLGQTQAGRRPFEAPGEYNLSPRLQHPAPEPAPGRAADRSCSSGPASASM